MVAIMSPNVISMPLMLLKGLCESGLIRRDYEDDADRCFTQGTSMLFVYSIAFNVLFWAGLYPLLIDQAAKINGGASEVAIASAAVSSVDSIQRLLGQSRAMLGRVAVTPAMVGIYAGLFIGLVPGLQGAIFGSKLTALTPLGGALRVLAAPVVCLNTLIMAASLAKVRLPQPVIDKYFWWVIVIQSFFQHSVADTVNQPRVEGVYIRSRRLLDDMRRQPHALTLTDMDPSGGATGEHIKPECKLSCRSGTDVEATTYYEVCGEEVKNPLNGQAGGMEDQYELSTAPSTSKGEPAVSVTLSTFLLHVLARYEPISYSVN